MTTNDCGSQYGREQCRFHGKRDRHEAARTIAQKEYVDALKTYLSGPISVECNENIVQKALTFSNIQAEVDAYDDNYETLTGEITQIEEDANVYKNYDLSYGQDEDSEYSDLVERKTKADIVRKQRKGDSNPYSLPVISDEFPHSVVEARKILKINKCGTLSGVRGVAGMNGEPLYQVVGTEGFYRVDSKGSMNAVGTIHALDHERTPDAVKKAAVHVPVGGNVGWKNLYKTIPAEPDQKFPTSKLVGYELYSATGYAITDTEGKVRERGNFLAVG